MIGGVVSCRALNSGVAKCATFHPVQILGSGGRAFIYFFSMLS